MPLPAVTDLALSVQYDKIVDREYNRPARVGDLYDGRPALDLAYSGVIWAYSRRIGDHAPVLPSW
jgi:hypothetical protein